MSVANSPKCTRFTCRVSSSIRNDVDAQAAERGLTRAAYLRELVDEATADVVLSRAERAILAREIRDAARHLAKKRKP